MEQGVGRVVLPLHSKHSGTKALQVNQPSLEQGAIICPKYKKKLT